MKKTAIALAIAAMTATSTNAVTLYEQNDTKVELDGSIRLWLGRDGGTMTRPYVNNMNYLWETKYTRPGRADLINDDSRVHLKATHKLSDELKAFAGWELRFDGSEISGAQAGGTADAGNQFGGITTRQLYAGFDFADIGRLSFGRQTTTADDVLQDDLYYRSGKFNILTTRGAKTVKFRSADWYGFSFGADYLFGGEKIEMANHSDTFNEYKRGYGVSLFYHYDFADDHKIDVALGYTEDQYRYTYSFFNNLPVKRNLRSYLLAMHYTLGDLKLGAAYGQRHKDFLDGPRTVDVADYLDEKFKGQYVFLEAKYDLQNLAGIPSTVALQYERYTRKKNIEDMPDKLYNRYNQWIAQIDYKFTPNVVSYIQYTHMRYNNRHLVFSTDLDHISENIYGVGLRVYF